MDVQVKTKHCTIPSTSSWNQFVDEKEPSDIEEEPEFYDINAKKDFWQKGESYTSKESAIGGNIFSNPTKDFYGQTYTADINHKNTIKVKSKQHQPIVRTANTAESKWGQFLVESKKENVEEEVESDSDEENEEYTTDINARLCHYLPQQFSEVDNKAYSSVNTPSANIALPQSSTKRPFSTLVQQIQTENINEMNENSVYKKKKIGLKGLELEPGKAQRLTHSKHTNETVPSFGLEGDLDSFLGDW